uniref:Histidine phosphatase family protein n=1 Tax=Globodera pallida TaxID=36090 RepID=A0A183C5D0_GLOPA
MGVPGLIYQVLVSLDWDYLRNFYYGCRMPNYCTVVKGYHKINFAIFRHGEKNIYRNERSKEWYAKVNDTISAVIASNAKIDDLGTLVEEIEAVCCSLLSDHLYNGFVLLHQSCFLAKDCDLSTGAAFSKDFGWRKVCGQQQTDPAWEVAQHAQMGAVKHWRNTPTHYPLTNELAAATDKMVTETVKLNNFFQLGKYTWATCCTGLMRVLRQHRSHAVNTLSGCQKTNLRCKA